MHTLQDLTVFAIRSQGIPELAFFSDAHAMVDGIISGEVKEILESVIHVTGSARFEPAISMAAVEYIAKATGGIKPYVSEDYLPKIISDFVGRRVPQDEEESDSLSVVVHSASEPRFWLNISLTKGASPTNVVVKGRVGPDVAALQANLLVNGGLLLTCEKNPHFFCVIHL